MPGTSCHTPEGRVACGNLELRINVTRFRNTVKTLNSSQLRADCKLLQISSCRFQIICLNRSGKYQTFTLMTNVLPNEMEKSFPNYSRDMQVALSHRTDSAPPQPPPNLRQPVLSKL